jgi:diphthine-ammonia ligase
VNNKKIAISWSGGKDCCLALDRLIKNNYDVACLFSMVSKKDERNHAHGTQLSFLQMQADALGIPLVMIDSAGNYEESMISGLIKLKEQFNLSTIAYGTLYVDEDRKWNEYVTNKAGLESMFPVWIDKNDATNLIEEWLESGYKAIICRAQETQFQSFIIGEPLNKETKELFIKKGICVMGEAGEYHTFVLDGPLFKEQLCIVDSETIMNSGLWSLNIREMKITKK